MTSLSCMRASASLIRIRASSWRGVATTTCTTQCHANQPGTQLSSTLCWAVALRCMQECSAILLVRQGPLVAGTRTLFVGCALHVLLTYLLQAALAAQLLVSLHELCCCLIVEAWCTACACIGNVLAQLLHADGLWDTQNSIVVRRASIQFWSLLCNFHAVEEYSLSVRLAKCIE